MLIIFSSGKKKKARNPRFLFAVHCSFSVKINWSPHRYTYGEMGEDLAQRAVKICILLYKWEGLHNSLELCRSLIDACHIKKKKKRNKNERNDYMFCVPATRRHVVDWSVGWCAALSKSRPARAYSIGYNSGKLFSKGDWVPLHMHRVAV